MQQSLKNIRNILIYTFVVALVSVAYFIYAYAVHPIPEERETFLTEMGEGFGKIGLAMLVFIYFRTLLKLLLGQGKLAQRLLPDYIPPIDSSHMNCLLTSVNVMHMYFGIDAIAIMLLVHALIGLPLYSHRLCVAP